MTLKHREETAGLWGRRRSVLRYGLAVVLPCLASLFWMLSALQGDGIPWLFLCAVCALCAWYGGLGPGVLSTLVSASASFVLYFTGPAHRASTLGEFGLQLLVFALIATVITTLHVTRQRAERELLHHALHDPLTGLPNRRLFSDRLDYLLAGAQRTGRSFAVLLLDLDDFKRVNDVLGHLQGDRLLDHVAQRLHFAARASDTVARWGGDEFALLLPETDERGALIMQRKLERLLAQPHVLNQDEVVILASAGMAIYPHDGASAEDLLSTADDRLYAIKRRRQRPPDQQAL